MSVNSSSSNNDSLLHHNLSSINSYDPFGLTCFLTRTGSLIYGASNIIRILLILPLCILVLYLGLQRWRKQRSTSTAAMSHSDSFTYHLLLMELAGVLGYSLCCCGVYRSDVNVLSVGYCLWYFTWIGETFFHTLTCVEHYLAVVHPITYLSLRKERGVRIRNVSIGCIWLISVGEIGLLIVEGGSSIMDFVVLFSALIIISFCSLSVLCVLIRPGPGDQGGDRERVDQSKKRAFYTILVILAVLLVRCVWNLTWGVLYMSIGSNDCVMMTCDMWFNLPGSLVLPLLFLQRAGTLACC